MTYAHKGGRCLSDDPLAAGVPSYVMQEEFNRYHGYWWQPKKNSGNKINHKLCDYLLDRAKKPKLYTVKDFKNHF